MNILLVLTGGTICTSVRDGLRSLDTDAASLRLVSEFRNSASPFASSAKFTIGAQFRTLSENMTVAVWNRIVEYFRTVDFSACDGIVIAHGTDTLAYTSSMFALLLTGIGVPVVFVSSNAPLEYGDARANGAANFRAAVDCIGYGIAPGVYAVYRNVTDGKTYLHDGCRLRQCGDYSEDFYSVGAREISAPLAPDALSGSSGRVALSDSSGRVALSGSSGRAALSGSSGRAAPSAPLLRTLDAPLSDCVLKIRPYVGIRYDAYRVENFRAVLHGTYHSGTACVGDGQSLHSILYLLDACADAGTELYLSPAWNQGELYDTVPVMLNHSRNGRKIIPLHGMTEETAYCKLLLWHSCGAIRERFPDFLTCDFCGEMVE